MKISLRLKITLYMTTIILIFGVLLGFVTFKNYKEQINKQITTKNSEIVNQFNDYIQRLQTDLLDISSIIYIDNELVNIISGRTAVSNKSINYTHNLMYSMIQFKNVINFVGITSPEQFKDGYYIALDGSFGMNDYHDIMKSAYFTEFQNKNLDFGCYLLPANDNNIIRSNKGNKLFFIRTIKDIQNDFKVIGYLVIGVGEDKLHKFYSIINDIEKSGVLLSDNQGRILTSYGTNLDKNIKQLLDENIKLSKDNYFYFDYNNTEYIVCYSNNNLLGFNTYYYTSTEELLSNIVNARQVVILLVGAVVLVFILISFLLSSLISSPIKRLLHSMKKVEKGDFNQYVDTKYNNEIGELINGYNLMIDKIKNLIEQNYAIKLKEKEAELTVLQAQINPHFLFNTLDFLYWKAKHNFQEELAEAVYLLSKLFRLSIKKGSNWINLKNECDFLSYYLAIQSMMFMKNFKYEINLQEEAKDLYIPRFILQPIVENALVHGFKEKTSDGFIQIKFELQKSSLICEITDNGVGMDKETLSKTFSDKTVTYCENDGSYAISNIMERLKIYFKQNFTLSANSQLGHGTVVKLVIPALISEPKVGGLNV